MTVNQANFLPVGDVSLRRERDIQDFDGMKTG
jgi:hypothetical protein